MRLNPLTRSARRRAVVHAAIDDYGQWRTECAAVRNAYRRWASASAAHEPLAFHAYRAALDREERAATLCAGLMRHAGQRAEIGLARQLAEIQNGAAGR